MAAGRLEDVPPRPFPRASFPVCRPRSGESGFPPICLLLGASCDRLGSSALLSSAVPAAAAPVRSLLPSPGPARRGHGARGLASSDGLCLAAGTGVVGGGCVPPQRPAGTKALPGAAGVQGRGGSRAGRRGPAGTPESPFCLPRWPRPPPPLRSCFGTHRCSVAGSAGQGPSALLGDSAVTCCGSRGVAGCGDSCYPS